MSNLIGFDPTKHDIPDDGFAEEQVLPQGEYQAMCIGITEGTNSLGSNYVKYKWQILDGAYKGAVITNFENPDPSNAERHGWYMRRLKSLMTICGVPVIQSLDQLQMIPLVISNKPYQSSNGSWSNSINYYKSVGQASSTQAAPVAAAPSRGAPVQAAPPTPAPVTPMSAVAPPAQVGPPVGVPVTAPPAAPAPQAAPVAAPVPLQQHQQPEVPNMEADLPF